MRSTVERLEPAQYGSDRARLTLELSSEDPAWDFAQGDGAADGSPHPAFVTAVSRQVHAALREHGLVPLRLPRVEIAGGEGGPLIASAVVDLRPPVELPDPATVEVTLPALGGDPDDRVEEQLALLRAEYVDLTPVDRPARFGDVVRLGSSAAIAGGSGDWLPAEGVEVELGAGALLDGLDEALAGLRAGQGTTITTRVPSGPDQGREALVTVTVQAVMEAREPDLDDAFAAAVGPCAGLAELRTALRVRFDYDRRAELLLDLRDAALVAVVRGAGLDPGRESDRHAVLDALADAEGIQVTIDELRELIAAEMSRSGVSARTFRKHLARDGVAARLHEYARRDKALVHLVRSVVVRDAAGGIVSFDEVAGRGPSSSRR